tara:strand:+ start:18235 stop:19302 length:1068 start_codon:yes stop_codon:yes gene_type:complete
MPSIEDGGVEKNFFIIANYLSKKHKNIELITTKKISSDRLTDIRVVNPFFNVEKFKGRKLKYFLCLFILLKKIIFNRNYVIFSFQANLYCILICNIFQNTIITRSNSSPEGWSKNPLKFFLYRKIISIADKVIVNSYDFKKEFKKKFSINAACILNPLNKNEIIKKSKIKVKNIYSKNSLRLMTIGRLVDQKNQITILKALNIIKKKINFQLMIIGKGEKKNNLIEFIKKNKLQKKIKILPFKSNPYPYLKQAEVFILSSKFEGLPNVLLEAQVLKKYIISSNCPTGPKEILNNGRSGDLFKMNDHHSLANLILRYKNKTNNNKKINLGFEQLNRYDSNINLKKYNQLISRYLKI